MRCGINDCVRQTYAKNLCEAHYTRKRKRMNMLNPIQSRNFHNKSNHPMYKRWSGMVERCRNPNNAKYYLYGEKGITVCERWLNFELFFRDMGEPPTNKHTLDRINPSGNYEPDNVKWATYHEQNIHLGMNSRNKSGYKGVYRDNTRNKWVASFGRNKSKRFDTIEQAIIARGKWMNHININYCAPPNERATMKNMASIRKEIYGKR